MQDNALATRKSSALTEVRGSLVIRDMEDLNRLSQMLSKSGFFRDAKDACQCGVKVLAGLEMGFGAFASMTGIHIISGKPAVGANLMAAAVKRHPRYNYRVIEQTNEVCKIAFYELWDGKMERVGISEFSLADAKTAKVYENNPNWKSYARNMLFARAMSNGVRWYCPDVFDAPVYTPEELGAEVDADGEVINVPVSRVDRIDVPEVMQPWEIPNAGNFDEVEPRREVVSPRTILLHWCEDNGVDPKVAARYLPKRCGVAKADALTAEQITEFCQYLARPTINNNQLKRLMAIANENGVSNATLKAYISEVYGHESKKDIKAGVEYDEICGWVQEMGSEPLHYADDGMPSGAPLAPREAPMTVAGVAIE